MGLEDETIAQKIRASRIDVRKHPPSTREPNVSSQIADFGEYDDELTRQLRLKTTRRTALGITYEKARQIVAEKKIISRDQYYALCQRDNRLSSEPDLLFRNQFTNWIEYLGISRVYYERDVCQNKISEYLSTYPDIRKNHLDLSAVCRELCQIDRMFPPCGLWVDYYGVRELSDIISISVKKKRLPAGII